MDMLYQNQEKANKVAESVVNFLSKAFPVGYELSRDYMPGIFRLRVDLPDDIHWEGIINPTLDLDDRCIKILASTIAAAWFEKKMFNQS